MEYKIVIKNVDKLSQDNIMKNKELILMKQMQTSNQ